MKKILSLLLLAPSFFLSAETISLFNGKDLSGWTMDIPQRDKAGPEDEAIIQNGVIVVNTHEAEWWRSIPSFIVRDGLLVSLGEPGGHLITENAYANYELVVEYRFSKTPGNCGVLVHSSDARCLYRMFPKSIEVQMKHQNAGDFWVICEDIEVPDMEARRPLAEGQRFGGGAKDARRIVKLTDAENPAGEWNTMKILCKGDEIIVHVNGILVNHGFNATVNSGRIALQAEGSEVEFRKVELTPLD